MVAERILNDANNIRRTADVFSSNDSGQLHIATTHTGRARPAGGNQKSFARTRGCGWCSIRAARRSFPCWPPAADIGIARTADERRIAGGTFPLLSLASHHSGAGRAQLTRQPQVTLEMLSTLPLITYRQGITGRAKLDAAFKAAGLTPDIALSAQDSDVIKTSTSSWGWAWVCWRTCRMKKSAIAGW